MTSKGELDEGILIGGTERILTAVRCRPMSFKELREDDRPIVLVDDEDEDNQGEVIILDPTYFSRKREYERSFFERTFRYDHSFLPDSTQEDVYNAIGKPLLKHSFEGFNSCLFVYGQTGSGKTYTMVGDQGDRSLSSSPGAEESELRDLEGVVPRLCRGLLREVFLREKVAAGIEIEEKLLTGADGLNLISAKVLASFYEIYNEKVFDLLSDTPSTPGRVREHPESGAFVEGLHRYEVKSYEDADGILNVGLEQRAVAETRMNKLSSRSHAVFTLYLMQKLQDPKHTKSSKRTDQDIYTERMSKIILVDLAGSERVSLTGATGERLVEANNINRSLSTLSDVIKALSDKGAAIQRERERQEAGEDPLNTSSESLAKLLSSGGKANSIFIPYRNSILTWLLKDCLGGNARTSILANISPAESSYNETMSTLRYVEKAKLIMSTVRVNETSTDPAFVMQLQKHIVSLQERIGHLNKAQSLRDAEIRVKLEAREKELESEFIRRTIELQDQLHYYRQLHGSVNPESPSSAFKGPNGDAMRESGGTGSMGLSGTLEMMKQEVTLLTSENTRLKDLLDQKEAIIAEYEDKFLHNDAGATLSAITSSDEENVVTPARSVTFATPIQEENSHDKPSTNSTIGSTGHADKDGGGKGSLGRMKALVLGYKKEKALVQQQYEALLIKVRETTARMESGRDHMNKLDVTKNSLQADLSLSRADRNRLKSELASKVEECNTFKSEVDFYRARIEALNAENKRKIGLMELHISRMKEAESILRTEKEEQLDRITELLAEREAIEARWETKFTESKEGADGKIAILEGSEERHLREKETLTLALNRAKGDLEALELKRQQSEVARVEAVNMHQKQQKELKSELQSKENRIVNLTNACKEKDRELERDRVALHRLQVSLIGVEKESEEAEQRLKNLSENFSIAMKKSDEELEQLHHDCTKRIEELNQSRSRNKDLARQLEEFQAERRQKEAEEKEYLHTVESLRRQISEEERAHTEALSQKEKSHAEALAEKEAQHATALGDMNDQVKRSEEHARAVEGDSLVKSKGLFGQLDKLQQELKVAEQRHSTTLKDLDDTRRKLEQAETELGKARMEIDKDEHLLEDKSKEHAHDVHEMHSLKAKMGDLNISLQQKEAEISKLDELVKILEEEISDMNTKLKDSEEEAREFSNKVDSLSQEIENAYTEITDLKANLDLSRTELVEHRDREQKAIKEKDQQLEMRKEAMRAVSEQLSKTECELEEAIASMQEQADFAKQVEDSNKTLQQQLNDTEERLQDMTDTARNADDVIVQLNRQIKSLQAEVRDADVLVKDLVRKHEKEKEEIEFLRGGGGNAVAMNIRRQMDDLEENRTEMMVELQEEREKEELLMQVAEELETENMRVQEALKREKEHEQELEKKLAAEMQHEKQLEEDLKREREHEAELEAALKREKQREEELEAALTREKEVERKLLRDLDSAHAELRVSRERESALKAQISEMSAMAPQISNDNREELPSALIIAELKEKLSNAETAGEALSAQVPQLQQEITSLTSQRDLALTQVEELESSQKLHLEQLKIQLQEEEHERKTMESKLKARVDEAVEVALQSQLDRCAILEADLAESREAQEEHNMIVDVYKSEISALTNTIKELTAELQTEREQAQKMMSEADQNDAVVLSVQKRQPDSPNQSYAPPDAELEAITASLIEAKMALAHETSEKQELESELNQIQKSNRLLSSEVSELKLKIGSLTASLKASELQAKRK